MRITHNDILRWIKSPPEKQTDKRDDSGLIVRRNVDGSLTFCTRRTFNGRKIRKTFGRYPDLSLADARRACRHWLGKLEEDMFAERPTFNATWQEVVDAYLVEAKATNKSWQNQRHLLTHYIPKSWQHRPASSILKAEIRNLLLTIGTQTPYQANRLKATISAAYNRAIDSELVETNPVQGMRRLFKEAPRKNVLNFEQIRGLWEACDGHDYPAARAIQLLLLTGARRGELLNARWDDIDPDRWLSVKENKANRPHKIFLSDLAWSLIDGMASREVSEYLFPSPSLDKPAKDIKMAKRTLARRADIGPWQVRDLRSTFLSHAVEHCGVLPVVAKVCANHEIPGITDANYIERTAYYPACKEAWIKWGQLVSGIVQGHTGQVLSIRQTVNT